MNPRLRDIIGQIPAEMREQVRTAVGDDARIKGLQVDGTTITIRVARIEMHTIVITPGNNDCDTVEAIDETQL